MDAGLPPEGLSQVADHVRACLVRQFIPNDKLPGVTQLLLVNMFRSRSLTSSMKSCSRHTRTALSMQLLSCDDQLLEIGDFWEFQQAIWGDISV